METTEISLKLSFDRKQITLLLALFLLAWHPGFLGSETLTLTTYYPAPYGGYVSILTTNQTLLARDAGNVGIRVGTTNVPRRPLDVNGEIVTSSRLTMAQNMDTTSRTWHLDNSGGRFRVFEQPNINVSGSEWLTILTGGNVGIGTTAPTQKLQVANGNLLITGNGTTTGNLTIQNGNINGLCSVVAYGFAPTSPCPARMRAIAFYGTAGCNSGGLLFLGGNLQDPGRWRSHVEQNCSGNMLCCRISQW